MSQVTPSEHLGADPPVAERADSRRKRLRLVEAARSAVAEHGLDVAAADIAARAEVGVGTLYRRFGSKEALIQAVLLDSLKPVVDAARAAIADDDPARGLDTLLRAIVGGQVANRGFSEYAATSEATWSEPVVALTQVLRGALRELVERAQSSGTLRTDLTWRDIAVIAQAASASAHCLGIEGGPQQWERTLAVVLTGLRSPSTCPLPGEHARDSSHGELTGPA